MDRGWGTPGAGRYQLTQLQNIESQSIHIIREVAAEFERPVLLFSGGKDSVVMLHLARRAFWPGRLELRAEAEDHQLPGVRHVLDQLRQQVQR